MYFTVYRLKDNGHRLDPEAARATAKSGELRITQKRPGGMPCPEATLISNRGMVSLTLSAPEVRRLTPSGMLIRGFESPDPAEVPKPQVWWCVPVASAQQP